MKQKQFNQKEDMMGTYAENTRTNITLDLAKLRQGYLNRTQEFQTLMESCGLGGWTTAFQEICESLARTSSVDQQHDRLIITQVSEENKVGWQDAYFAALAPFAQEGDYAEFRCREYGTWRYICHVGKFIEQAGTVTVQYPPLQVLDRPKAKGRKAKRG